jgi:tetratricopeptide (TPR) repeat protein
MQTENDLWALMPSTPDDQNSWLLRAARQCREHHCEACIAILVGAVQAEQNNYAIHFQMGVCCSGGCRVHLQTSAEIALTYLRLALTLVSPSEQPKERAQILSAMGNTWLISSQESVAVRLQAAISCFKEAARTYLGVGDMEAWAREEFNLGNSYCEWSGKTSPSKWEEAVSHYQKALQVRTKERDPVRYAATLENLGSAYRELSSGDRAVNVRKAILCYRQALQVYTLVLFPLKNAGLHNNLGNAYVSLPCSNSLGVRRNMRRALRHYERALRLRTKVSFPGDYAVTQFNRGSAFLRLALGDPNPQPNLRSAQICFEEAGTGFTQGGQAARAQVAREQANLVCSSLPSARAGEARG